MTIALWIINIILALVFLAAGGNKLAKSAEALAAAGMTWTAHAPSGVVKLVGALEVLGAIGLIAPLATGIAPVLTPIAAVCLTLTMLGAVITHAALKDGVKAMAPSIALGLLAVVSAVIGFALV